MSIYSDLTEQVFRRALERARASLRPTLVTKLEGLLDSGKFHSGEVIIEAIRSDADSHADL